MIPVVIESPYVGDAEVDEVYQAVLGRIAGEGVLT